MRTSPASSRLGGSPVSRRRRLGERPPFRGPRSSTRRAAGEDRGSAAPIDAAIPQDVLHLFKDAQQRIVDLNQSRLHALEELAEARAKIIELEERLTQSERDALGMTMEVAKEAKEIKAAASLPSAATPSAPAEVEEAAQPAPSAASDGDDGGDENDDDDGLDSSPSVATGVISILYETAWDPVFIHFTCPEHSGWTDSPGMKMKTGELPNHKIFSITASSLEFVLNDGEYEWDKPSYDANYFVGSPGSYILKNGKLDKVR